MLLFSAESRQYNQRLNAINKMTNFRFLNVLWLLQSVCQLFPWCDSVSTLTVNCISVKTFLLLPVLKGMPGTISCYCRVSTGCQSSLTIKWGETVLYLFWCNLLELKALCLQVSSEPFVALVLFMQLSPFLRLLNVGLGSHYLAKYLAPFGWATVGYLYIR